MLKLGSLFDGSGGFPLAALNVGIRSGTAMCAVDNAADSESDRR